MNIVCVIPARYQSSRFPGKPLADIHGRPMIWWTYQNAKRSGLQVMVATDSIKIEQACRAERMDVMLTSDKHLTGVDRLAEVCSRTKFDWYVLVQGDEPLLEAETIKAMAGCIENDEMSSGVLTFKTPVRNPVDIVNTTIIKIVTDLKDNVLIASRSPVPYPKADIGFRYYKSVGVYAYPREVLLKYPGLERGYLEKAEDHDFMRMLENGIQIKAYTRDTETISVDTPKDLERVKKIMEERNGADFKKQ